MSALSSLCPVPPVNSVRLKIQSTRSHLHGMPGRRADLVSKKSQGPHHREKENPPFFNFVSIIFFLCGLAIPHRCPKSPPLVELFSILCPLTPRRKSLHVGIFRNPLRIEERRRG